MPRDLDFHVAMPLHDHLRFLRSWNGVKREGKGLSVKREG